MKVLRGFRNQCPTCREYFNSNGAFDKHRFGEHGSLNRKCRSPEEMSKIGMCLNKGGFWIAEPFSSKETIQKLRSNEDDEAQTT